MYSKGVRRKIILWMKPYYTGLQRTSGPLMSKWAIWLFKGAELQWEVFPKFMTVEPQKHAQSLEELASYRIYSGKAPTIYISKVADPCNQFSFSGRKKHRTFHRSLENAQWLFGVGPTSSRAPEPDVQLPN